MSNTDDTEAIGMLVFSLIAFVIGLLIVNGQLDWVMTIPF